MQTKLQEKTNLRAALGMVLAVSETIRELGSVPSGHLYTLLMGVLDIENYQSIIRTIEGAGLIKVDGSYLITWIGPALEIGK